MSNNYILATENNYNNPMVLCFLSSKERSTYLKDNYKMYSVNTKFYLYDDIVSFFESPYYEKQVSLLKSKYHLIPDDNSYLIFKSEVQGIVDEIEFDSSIYNIENNFEL